MELLEAAGLTGSRYGFAIGTPREPERRGGHVAVEHAEGARIARALKGRGIVPDYRPPNVIRLAPVPMYNTFHEVWRTVGALREIVEEGEHLRGEGGRELVA
jgi:kynureninase